MPSDQNGKLSIEQRRAARDNIAKTIVAALNQGPENAHLA
jgi:hypothetical protein